MQKQKERRMETNAKKDQKIVKKDKKRERKVKKT